MYAQTDFTVIDPRMGTLAELRELTTAAHARGMFVLVDIVVNHMADKLGFAGHVPVPTCARCDAVSAGHSGLAAWSL